MSSSSIDPINPTHINSPYLIKPKSSKNADIVNMEKNVAKFQIKRNKNYGTYSTNPTTFSMSSNPIYNIGFQANLESNIEKELDPNKLASMYQLRVILSHIIRPPAGENLLTITPEVKEEILNILKELNFTIYDLSFGNLTTILSKLSPKAREEIDSELFKRLTRKNDAYYTNQQTKNRETDAETLRHPPPRKAHLSLTGGRRKIHKTGKKTRRNRYKTRKTRRPYRKN